MNNNNVKNKISVNPFIPLILLVTAIISSLIFYKDKVELVRGVADSALWLHNINYSNFTKPTGTIYLDRLDRSHEYEISIKLHLNNPISVGSITIDGIEKSDDELNLKVEPGTRNKYSLNTLQIILPRKNSRGAVIEIELSSPSRRGLRDIRKKTELTAVTITNPRAGSDLIKIIGISTIIAVIGSAIYLLLIKRFSRKIYALCLAASVIMILVFLLNLFDFSFIYFVATERIYLYIYLSIAASLLAIGSIPVFNYMKENHVVACKIAVAAIFLLCLIMSLWSFTNDFYIDDYLWMRPYPISHLLKSFSGPVDPTGSLPGYYRPLSLVLMQIQYLLFGKSYSLYYLFRSFHLFLNALLVYFICTRIIKKTVPSFAAVNLMIFSVFSVSAVAWISNFFDVLMISFMLAAVLARISCDRFRNSLAVWLFFVAALMSKETAVMLPFLLIAADLVTGRKIIKKKAIFFYAIIFLTLSIYFTIRFVSLGGLAGMVDQHDFYSLSNIGGILERIVKVFISLFTFSGIFYPEAENIAGVVLRSAFALGLLSALIAAACYKKKRIIANPSIRLSLFGLSWILIVSAPVLFPFDLVRLAYILLPGLVFFAAGSLSLTVESRFKYLKYLLMSLLILSLAQQTVAHYRYGYQKYGKGSSFRYAKNLSIFNAWQKDLPEEVKRNWLEGISYQKKE